MNWLIKEPGRKNEAGSPSATEHPGGPAGLSILPEGHGRRKERGADGR